MLKNKPIWRTSTPEQKVILITILLMANHKVNEWEWKGERFEVKPGEFVTSLESIKNEAGKGISIQNVRSALNRFKKLEFLTEKSTKSGRVITVCNWESYQDNKEVVQQRKQQIGNKDLTPNKNDKNVRTEISVIFDQFRKAYPGTKRGNEVELKNFLKKNKPEVVHLLFPALQKEISYKDDLTKSGTFRPEWKNLKTWINNQCWTQEFPEINKQSHEPSIQAI
nr:hypothetical protein [uncultured Draconibacterium sp.]